MRALHGLLGTLAPLIAVACGGTTLTASSGDTTGASSSSTGGAGATTTSASTAASSTASSSSGGGGGAGGASAGMTIAFGGTVVQVPVNVLLSSVQICVDQHPEIACETTDSAGAFTMMVPANAEIAVTLAKPGYAGIVVPIVTSTLDETQWEIGLPTSSSTASFYGATYPDSAHGFLSLYTNPAANAQEGEAGVVPSMSPSSGEGPLYAGTSLQTPDPTLQATSSVGNARFAGVAPGTVELTLGPSTLTCTPTFGGWSAPVANAARVPILAGFETHVGFSCQ